MKTIVKFLIAVVFVLSPFVPVKAQPLAPFNLKAVVGHWGTMMTNFEYVNLSWQFTTNGPSSNLRFNIYRKTGAISDTGKFVKRYSHIPFNFWRDQYVQRGQTYSYFVTAVNGMGESGPSDTVQVTIDSAIAKATVSGTLKDNMTASVIANGTVTFIPVFGWGMTRVKTDSSGNFTAKVYPGVYIVYANAPGFIPAYYNNVRYIFNATKITLTSNEQLTLNLTLQARPVVQHYKLSGVVKDSLGNPVKSFITVHSLEYNAYHKRFFYTATDDSGRYSVNVLGGDTVVVYARSMDRQFFPQYYNGKTSFLTADRIGISGDTSNINFILAHKPVYNNGISGSVQNSDSIGVESIVMAIRLGVNDNIKDMDDWRRKYSAESDSNGNYSFVHMLPGTYILLAMPEGDYQPTFYRADGTQTMKWKEADSVIVDTSGVISNINFVVMDEPDSGAATVAGHVQDNSGNPLAGALVFANDANQQTFSFGVTDMNGNYTISGLVPGSYSVNSDSYGYSSAQSSTVSVDYSTAYSTSASFTLTPESVTAVKDQQPNIISGFKLNQNYPNPFNPTTIISYQIPSDSKVVLKVYNILGDEVATLVNGNKAAGSYSVQFNASNLASGVYFYQIKAGNFVDTKKLVLLK